MNKMRCSEDFTICNGNEAALIASSEEGRQIGRQTGRNKKLCTSSTEVQPTSRKQENISVALYISDTKS